MTREEFKYLAKSRVLLMDGATGSNLLAAGMPAGVCAEAWILEHPEACIRLQSDYLAAGAQIVYAPTFSGNRISLREKGLDLSVEELNGQLAALTKKALGGKALTAGDMTMTGGSLIPQGELSFDELVECYKEQASALFHAGVDLFVVETMVSLQEMRAAVLAIQSICELPILATFTVNDKGMTFLGTGVCAAAKTLEAMGVDAVGINCSMGPDQMADVVASLKKTVAIPVIAKANAGHPEHENGRTVYKMEPEVYAAHAKELLKAGADLIGGCCGTTPATIEALHQLLLEENRYLPLEQSGVSDLPAVDAGDFLATERKLFALSELTERSTLGVAAENPELQECLEGGDFEDLMDEFEEVEEDELLIINVDMLEEDQVEEAVAGIAAAGLPICFDSAKEAMLERLLRYYPGRAAVRSTTLKQLTGGQKIAARYGACVIDE